ncbi:MAG TPA: dTDP-4-dehydrorhamnose 3,5-epimerase [Chlamydiales bacterium]|nr:dTDP-4-dehydrorhamnose 3,5-epimerase [Chlamydiales bacterium]
MKISGLKLIKPQVYPDSRGLFFESYREPQYEIKFVQDNFSLSKKNVLRGMHFQAEPGQDKLVTVLQGQVFDVVVDMRVGSPTFGKWEAVILDDKNRFLLYIPKGFAHGYLVLSDEALFHYKVSSFYNPKTECGFLWNDPKIGIAWPVKDPILSERDLKNPNFNSYEKNLGIRSIGATRKRDSSALTKK